MPAIKLRLITPSRVILEDEIDMVVVRTVEGDLGVLKGHQDTTAMLGYGIMKVYKNGALSVYSVLGGFLEVSSNRVSVMADAAEKPDEIDVKRANAARERARRLMNERKAAADATVAELAHRRALVRIEVSSYPLLNK